MSESKSVQLNFHDIGLDDRVLKVSITKAKICIIAHVVGRVGFVVPSHPSLNSIKKIPTLRLDSRT